MRKYPVISTEPYALSLLLYPMQTLSRD